MDYRFFQFSLEMAKKNNLITMEDTEEIFTFDPGKKIYVPAESLLKKNIQKQLHSEVSTHRVNEILNSIRRQTYIDREEFLVDKKYIPLSNKILDFEKMELLDYTPDFYFMKKHPIELTTIPKETNNPISEWLVSVTGTQKDEVMLKEIAGYCFYRGMPFQNFFLLVGAGGNGKSVYLNILQAMLGKENVSGVSLQQLGNPNDRFSSGELYQKNANIFGDLSAKSLTDTGTIKQLTGNDIITCERKFKNAFSFRNYAKLIASCNAVPESPEYSDAWVRRPVIINFPYSFIGREKRNIFEELVTPENLNKFFIECILAFKDALNQNTLIKNESLEEKKNQYLRFSNSAGSFIEERMDYDPEEFLSTEEIYSKYKEYCEENQLVKKDERGFFKTMYKSFNHKVWKKKQQIVGVRQYFIMGVCWK